MDDLIRARAEIRQGNFSSAETILDGILDRPNEVTSHLLFDVTVAYEELLRATGRYDDLIRISRRCMDTAGCLPEMDMHIHSAHTLIVIAGAEIALGRRDDAARTVRAAQELVERFPAGRFAASSRARINILRVRLKSLQKASTEGAFPVRSIRETPDPDSGAGGEKWHAFALQRHPSPKEVKTSLATLRRYAGPAAAVAIVVEWALITPRLSGIGSIPETFAAFIDELASIAAAHDLSFDSLRDLSQMVHNWDNQEGPWLQRLISANRKSGLAEKLQSLRRALETKVRREMNSIDKRVGLLESLGIGTILDGARDRDYEAELLRLDAEIDQLRAFIPSALSDQLTLLNNRMILLMAAVDYEIHRRNEAYARLLAALAYAADGEALADLKTAIEHQLPATMRERRELQQAIRQADDRLLMAELESLEKSERSMLRAKLGGVQGVDLANLLFREFGFDLPTARKLVIDRNNGYINLESLLDRVVEHRRRQAR